MPRASIYGRFCSVLDHASQFVVRFLCFISFEAQVLNRQALLSDGFILVVELSDKNLSGGPCAICDTAVPPLSTPAPKTGVFCLIRRGQCRRMVYYADITVIADFYMLLVWCSCCCGAGPKSTGAVGRRSRVAAEPIVASCRSVASRLLIPQRVVRTPFSPNNPASSSFSHCFSLPLSPPRQTYRLVRCCLSPPDWNRKNAPSQKENG